MSRRGRALALAAAVLACLPALAGCERSRAALGDLTARLRPAGAAAAPAPRPVSAADRQRTDDVLGVTMLGGAAAHRAAPADGASGAGPGAVAPAEGGIQGAEVRAQAGARRGIATRQLLEAWAKAQGAERKNEPDLVRQAQRLLAALGYYDGPVNGVSGPLTKDAVRRFQAIEGVPETGDVSLALMVALRAAL